MLMQDASYSLSPRLELQSYLCDGLEGQKYGQLSDVQSKKPDQALFEEGDRADHIYEVLRGMVRLSKMLPDGRRQVTGFLRAGQLFGLAPEGRHVFSAEAIGPVELRRYSRANFDRLFDEIPGFARRVLSATSHELRAAQDQMLLLGRKTAQEKLASFLLNLRIGKTVETPMSRADIADYLGLTVETVSRTVSKMKQDRLITIVSMSQISILQLARLEELAAGECE